MAKRFRVSRSLRSWACANIILDNGLFDEFKVFEYNHPKIKSKYRLANLFLLKKKLLYKHFEHPVEVNMDTLEDYYWYEPNDYESGDIGSATIDELHLQNGDF